MRMQGRAICHGCAIPLGLLGTSSRGNPRQSNALNNYNNGALQ
jgi:hypothetical protein